MERQKKSFQLGYKENNLKLNDDNITLVIRVNGKHSVGTGLNSLIS